MNDDNTPSGQAIPLAQLPAIAHDVLANRYTMVATLAVLVYDYFLTVDDEIRLVWPGNFTLPKIVFFINRYCPFVASIFITHFALLARDHSACSVGFFMGIGFVLVGYIVAEAILFLRVYAIWGRDPYIKVILLALLFVFSAIGIYINAVFLRDVTIPNVVFFHQGCSFDFQNRIIWVNILALLVCETVSISLLAYKSIRTVHHSASRVIKLMYQDGIFYFACILIISIANLVVVLTASDLLCDILLYTQGIMHNILANRLLLRLRGAYTSLNVYDGDSTITTKPHGFSQTITRLNFRVPGSSKFQNGRRGRVQTDSLFNSIGDISGFTETDAGSSAAGTGFEMSALEPKE